MYQKKHVLIPIDFSSTSLEAVEVIRDLTFPNIEISLLHIFNPIQLQGPTLRDGVLPPTGLTKDMEKDVLDKLKCIRDSELSEVEQVSLNVKFSRYPAKAICLFAVRERVNLVIMTAYGRSVLSRGAMGSVAEGVIRKAPCAVLLLRNGKYAIGRDDENARYASNSQSVRIFS